MLELTQVEASYGAVRALKGVSLAVRPAEIVCLLGANGAGKTTTVRCISGLVGLDAGQIRLDGQPIPSRAPEEIVRLGIAHAPEGRRIFPGLTVEENLLVAVAGRRDKSGVAQDLKRIMELFPILHDRRRQWGWSLSGGEQQMLCIGRALIAKPNYLLLDEPSLGLAPKIVSGLFRTIQEINRAGIAVLLVEQNARQALRIAHRAYVLENGRIAQEGEAGALLQDDRIQQAYLGGP